MHTIPVSSEDQAFLFQLYASTRKDELSLWGWDEVMQHNFLKMQWTAQQQSYDQQFVDSDHCIILLENLPVGSMILSRSDQRIRLVDIALHLSTQASARKLRRHPRIIIVHHVKFAYHTKRNLDSFY